MNYISPKASRGPAPFGRAPVPPRPAQPRPAAAAAAWGVWNVRRPLGRPCGGAGVPGHLSSPLGRAAAQCNAMQCSVMQRNAMQRSIVLSRAVPGGTVQCGKDRSFHRASARGKNRGPLCSDTARRAEGLARCWRGRGVSRFPPGSGGAAGRCPVWRTQQRLRPRYPPLPAGPRPAAACHSLPVIYSPSAGESAPCPYLELNLVRGRGQRRLLCAAAVPPQPVPQACDTLPKEPGTTPLPSPSCALPAPSDHLKGRGTCPRAFTAKLWRLKGVEAATVCPCVVVAER